MENDYDKAAEGFEKIIKKGNIDEDILKNSKLAIETILKFKAYGGKLYEKAIWGNFYNQIELPSLAIIQFNQALKINPYYRDAYLGLGKAYSLEKKYSESEKKYKKAYELDPVYGLTFYFLGKNYQDQKMPDKAIESYKMAIERGYNNESIRKNMAEAYMTKKDYQQALLEYQEALSFNKNDLDTYEKIVWLLGDKLNRANDANKIAQEVDSIEPKTALSYNIMAEADLVNNQLNSARQNINQAIVKDNNFALNYYNLGLINQKEGDSVEAKKNFIKAVNLANKGNIYNQAYEKLKNL